jgi:hypothetical protein
MPLATLVSSSPESPVAAAGLAAILALALVGLWRRVRGTTLAAPAVWAVVAAAGLATVESLLAWRPAWEGSLGESLARYGAAAGTCCPLVAVLGAKRPQDRGWQWVVLSLWIVLLVPAGQAWLARAGSQLVLPTAWRGVLMALIALGPLNYLATRSGLSSLVVAWGQFTLLKPWLHASLASTPTTLPAVGLFCAAIALAVAPRLWSGEAAPATPLDALSQRWRRFRNGWGAFWGLRILNRINEAAVAAEWPVRLGWGGFIATDADAAEPTDERAVAHIEQTLDSLLRRFEPA